MKYIKLLFVIVMCVSQTISANRLPKERNERIEEMAKEGCNLIDILFDQALTGIAAKQDIMDPAWINKCEEIKKIQNLMADSTLIFCFDQNIANPIPELLQEYLQSKIQSEAAKIFSIDKISTKNVRNFYELSHTICELSQGRDCDRMMQQIKSENFHCLLKLEMQKIARKRLRKEEARQLRQRLMLGSRGQ